MLSLAISSLGKQDGGRWRKIIWTFSLAMDPLPPRGVRGAGQGDSLGQYSGAGGGSCSREGGRGSHRGESEWFALPDQPALRWSLQNIETTRRASAVEIRRRDSCWRCQLKPGVHTHTHAYKLMTGGVEVLKGVTALSGSVPPCPLLPTGTPHPPPLRGHGTPHKTDTWNIELSIQCLYVTACVWQRVRVIVRMRELLIRCLCYVCLWLFGVCAWGVTICVMELLILRTWTQPPIDSEKHNTGMQVR